MSKSLNRLNKEGGYNLPELISIICEDNAKAVTCLLTGFIASEVAKTVPKEDVCQMFFALDMAGIYGNDIVRLYNRSESATAFIGVIGMLVTEAIDAEQVHLIINSNSHKDAIRNLLISVMDKVEAKSKMNDEGDEDATRH